MSLRYLLRTFHHSLHHIDHDHDSEGQICILSETFLSYMSGNQLCKVNNGGCSHLCLLTPDGYQCACPDGLPLQPDEKKCLTGNKQINNSPKWNNKCPLCLSFFHNCSDLPCNKRLYVFSSFQNSQVFFFLLRDITSDKCNCILIPVQHIEFH